MYKRNTTDWVHFQIQNQKGRDSMSPPPPWERKKSKRCTNEKRYRIMYKRNTNDWVHFRIQNLKRGDSMSPASPGRGRKVSGVQTKKDYTIVYKRSTNDWAHFRILNQKRGVGDMHLIFKSNFPRRRILHFCRNECPEPELVAIASAILCRTPEVVTWRAHSLLHIFIWRADVRATWVNLEFDIIKNSLFFYISTHIMYVRRNDKFRLRLGNFSFSRFARLITTVRPRPWSSCATVCHLRNVKENLYGSLNANAVIVCNNFESVFKFWRIVDGDVRSLFLVAKKKKNPTRSLYFVQ